MITPYVLSFLAYFAILLAIGLLSHKRQTSSEDFIVGSRSLNFWVTALTAHASDMSAWLFMGFPAALFIGGLPQIWIALGLILGMFLNWQFVAERLRVETEKLNSFTLSTFFEKKYNDTSGLLRTLTALMTLFFMTTYLSAGLYGMGLLFESLFGINFYIGLLVASSVVVIYTFTGGFITVAWTDFFQGIFLLIAIVAVPLLAFYKVGGWGAVEAAALQKDVTLTLIKDYSFDAFLAIFLISAGWGLGYYGQPHIVTKFMGIRHPTEIYKSKYLGMSWQILTLGAAALTGLIGLAFFNEPLHDKELVFVEMVKALFNPLLGGFVLCGLIAANMSTMDSQLLVSASVLSEDIYKHLFNKSANPLILLRASRASVIVIALISLLTAFFTDSTLMQMVQYAWSGLGSAFGPLVLMSLYSKETNRLGAMAGILVGGTVAAVWIILNPILTVYPIPSMIPGFFLSLLAIRVVSHITQKASQKGERVS